MKQDAAWASSLGVSEAQLTEWKALAEGHLSLLVWCLENQKIEEENYLAWAQKNYQVSHLKSDFFKSQPLPFDLFDQYFPLIPKNAIPVTLWDGVLFIASPDPLPTIELDRPHQWVLASWIQIVNWRNQYEKELNAKSNGASALSSLDFGNLGGEVTKAPAVEASKPNPVPAPDVAEKEKPSSFTELSFASVTADQSVVTAPAVAAAPAAVPPAPAASTAPAAPAAIPLPPPQMKSESAPVAPLQAVQKPAPQAPAAAPTNRPAPIAPLAPKVNPPPKISPMPVRVAPVSPAPSAVV
ncbi:MAG: hypothetical protein K2X47_18650, partial [Bdellovibrionales bacterium]|nr:hypothetical protein [Bdellovibrionales bacterium]